MAKASGRKLKVFQARFGFHDSVVAAPSQVAALRAWGTRQNLFAEGLARLADDPAAIAAARAHPGVPLRRPVGVEAAFALQPSGLPDIPAGPKRPNGRAKAARAHRPAPEPEPVDRSALDAAEAALHAVDERRRREEARLRDDQAELDRRTAGRQATYVATRKAAASAVAAARAAYRKAGGRD